MVSPKLISPDRRPQTPQRVSAWTRRAEAPLSRMTIHLWPNISVSRTARTAAA